MQKYIRMPQFPTGAFGIGVLAFLLPFLTVSCNGGGQSLGMLQLSGVQLATGTVYNTTRLGADLHIVIAVLALIAGAIMCFINVTTKSRAVALNIYRICCGLGFLSALMLLLFKSYADQVNSFNGLSQQMEAGAGVKYELGFWIALLSSIVACIVCGYISYRPSLVLEKEVSIA